MAKFDLASYKGKIQGHISLYSSSVPRKYILPEVVHNFLEKYPNVTFTLSDNDSENVNKGIIKGDTDFGIVGAKYNSPNLSYIDLMEDQLLLITPNSSKYSKENFSTIELNDILKEKILLREEGSGTRVLFEEALNKKKISLSSLNIVAYIEDTETIKELVSLGSGISFISKKAVKEDISNGRYKAFYINGLNLVRNFYFVYHNKRQLSPLNETFKKHVFDFIEANK